MNYVSYKSLFDPANEIRLHEEKKEHFQNDLVVRLNGEEEGIISNIKSQIFTAADEKNDESFQFSVNKLLDITNSRKSTVQAIFSPDFGELLMNCLIEQENENSLIHTLKMIEVFCSYSKFHSFFFISHDLMNESFVKNLIFSENYEISNISWRIMIETVPLFSNGQISFDFAIFLQSCLEKCSQMPQTDENILDFILKYFIFINIPDHLTIVCEIISTIQDGITTTKSDNTISKICHTLITFNHELFYLLNNEKIIKKLSKNFKNYEAERSNEDFVQQFLAFMYRVLYIVDHHHSVVMFKYIKFSLLEELYKSENDYISTLATDILSLIPTIEDNLNKGKTEFRLFCKKTDLVNVILSTFNDGSFSRKEAALRFIKNIFIYEEMEFYQSIMEANYPKLATEFVFSANDTNILKVYVTTIGLLFGFSCLLDEESILNEQLLKCNVTEQIEDIDTENNEDLISITKMYFEIIFSFVEKQNNDNIV